MSRAGCTRSCLPSDLEQPPLHGQCPSSPRRPHGQGEDQHSCVPLAAKQEPPHHPRQLPLHPESPQREERRDGMLAATFLNGRTGAGRSPLVAAGGRLGKGATVLGLDRHPSRPKERSDAGEGES
jgi:hypothetical protein